MSPFMICNKCYRVEVAFDVEENCTMALFGVGGRGKGEGARESELIVSW